jgi:chemotaxis protein methyltransferase CheR
MSFVSSGSGPEISPTLLPRFLALISARTGLQIRDKDRGDLQRTLRERMGALKIDRAEAYFHLLEAQFSLTQGEWTRLLPRLTNGESYFWRDKGQFSLLRSRILPELIESRASRRSLRIWSAGCSTGEEPYSLAMLVDELLPNREGWNVSIMGTDINPVALERARAGLYGAWAFRGLDIAVQEKYFERSKSDFQISSKLKAMVSFGPCNLRGDEFPSRVSGLFDMDLILCRNVLIYFSSEAIAHALQGFARTLRQDGYLLTGHAELANHDPAPLVPRAFAESVAYQKCQAQLKTSSPRPFIDLASHAPKPSAVATSAPAFPPAIALRRVPLISLPETAAASNLPAPPLARSGAGDASSSGSSPQPSSGISAATLCQRARGSADLGRHDEAIGFCREAIALDSTYDDAYFIWAQVESERGQREEAKSLFKKVIYLAPARYDAHLEMAGLYDIENDGVRARRERQAALELLQSLPPAEMSVTHPGVSVQELRHHLHQELQTTTTDNANARTRGTR